jgi:tryptophanyl-tRNA synthetase
MLTTGYEDTSPLQEHIRAVLIDWLAAGLNPGVATLFIQSHVPEHAELHLLLSMVTPLGWLERVPTYKEQQEQLRERDLATYGFLGYPLLQSADILLYRADFVPVGEDQVAHVEITREIARRFNYLYGGEVFPEPEVMVGNVPTLPGVDGQSKMSKSLGNAILLSDDAKTVEQKVMRMYTDPTRIHATDPGHVRGNPVFTYHDAFNTDKDEVRDLKRRYTAGKVGDVEVKRKLVAALNNFLAPMRERRAEYAAHPKRLDEILVEGTRRTQALAAETWRMVKEQMGTKFPMFEAAN